MQFKSILETAWVGVTMLVKKWMVRNWYIFAYLSKANNKDKQEAMRS